MTSFGTHMTLEPTQQTQSPLPPNFLKAVLSSSKGKEVFVPRCKGLLPGPYNADRMLT